MTIEARVFDFESDFAASLRCIPMAVRFKLDLAGIKLSLRQWSRFGREERARLLVLPCEASSEVTLYHARLIRLIETLCDEPVKTLAAEAAPLWDHVDAVPPALQVYAAGQGVRAPTRRQWAGLTLLQRFALIKLTREKHENANFVPALREFGVLNHAAPVFEALEARSA
jgi:hypothetical protein